MIAMSCGRRNLRLAGSVFGLLLAAGAGASAECFSVATSEMQALTRYYANSAVLIEVKGPEPDQCRESGTGVLISSAGDILTARHVVERPGCSKTGIFGIFAWDQANEVPLEVAKYDDNDAAFLRPKDQASWDSSNRKYCTAPIADPEGAERENFVRFGRLDFGSETIGYGGNIILSSAKSGRPPLQLVCTMIRHGDSGGPLFSGATGKLLGITVIRRDADKYGYPIYNQGYIFPAKPLWATHPQHFDDKAQCGGVRGSADGWKDVMEMSAPVSAGGPVQHISVSDLELKVPYEFSIGPRAETSQAAPQSTVTDATTRTALTTQIFSPVFGYSFAKVEKTIATDGSGKSVAFRPCTAGAAANCVTTYIANNLLTVVARSVQTEGGPEPIRGVVVYTRQTLGKTGTDFLFATNPNLYKGFTAAMKRGSVSPEQVMLVLPTLAQAPADKRAAGSIRIEKAAASNVADAVGDNLAKFEFSATGGKTVDWLSGSRLDSLKRAIDTTATFAK